MQRSQQPMSLGVLKREFDQGNIDLKPKYQRNPVWSKSNKIYLIDTILRGLPLPKFFMEQEVNSELGKIVYKVIDGQQRIRAIIEFLWGDIRLDPKLHPFPDDLPQEWVSKSFQQLTTQEQEKFWKYEITVELLSDATKGEIENMFIRLNKNTVKLNNQELRHAQYDGDFITLVEELAEEYRTFFINNKIFTLSNLSRMGDIEFVSELLVSLMYGIQDKKTSLDSFYASNEHMDESSKSWVPKRFRSIIKHISEILGKELPTTRFKSKGDFYSLFRALFELKEEKFTSNKEVNDQIKNVLIYITSEASEESSIDIMRKYWESTQEGTDTLRNRNFRNGVLKDLIEPLLIPKDKNRNFTETQKQIIWHTSEPKSCAICGKSVEKYADYEPDHIIPWSEGGFTTIDNGQIAHGSCNRKKGKSTP